MSSACATISAMITMRDAMSTRARYLQLADQIREAIARGQYAPGQPLPSEAQLMAAHNVSRTTVRQAIATLRTEGRITVAQGRGAFVRTRPELRRTTTIRPYNPSERPSRGQMPPGHEIRVIRVEVLTATPDIARWLEIDEGAEVVVRRRELWVHSEPMQLWDAYYPALLVAGTDLARPGFVNSGSYAALERLGYSPVRADEEITARMPEPAEATALHLTQGVPVINIVRVTRGQDNRPLFAFVIIAPGDRNAFVYADLPLVGPLGDPPASTS